MNILGLDCYGHSAAASLVQDGRVVAAAEEERFVRRKYTGEFPANAIRYCLDAGGITMKDVDRIGFFWQPLITFLHIPGYVVRYFPNSLKVIKELKDVTLEENLGMVGLMNTIRQLPRTIERGFGLPGRLKAKVSFLEHHFCHAASCFLVSPFERAAILTVDGMGEWTTTMLAVGEGTRIKPLKKVRAPHSAGGLYNAVSGYLGFGLLEGPGKVMGLSAYGDRDRFYDDFRKIVTLRPDGTFSFDMGYFEYHYRRSRGYSQKFIETFGPPRRPGDPLDERHRDVAAGLQRITEDLMIHMARHLHSVTKLKTLCIAGGVGLNSVANGKLLTESPFENFFIQPAAGDAGTSLGAAMLVNHALLKRDRSYVFEHAYLGPEYTRQQCDEALRSHHVDYRYEPNLSRAAAELIAKGAFVGWFQGRMEFGPRALGNRSILADPRDPDMKDKLNSRVKFRESFRPYAPAVLEEEVGEYFDQIAPNPYMLIVYNVLPDKRSVIPAVTHVDGTARVQTVGRATNPPLWDLIKEFKALTGVPVVLNTSFNIKGEPIVCSPEDAVRCFLKTNLDYLVMDNFIARKHP